MKPAENILKKYYELMSWQEVAYFMGVSKAMAWRVARGYEPKRPDIRRNLGFPALSPTPVCPACGIVHVKKCPQAVTKPNKKYNYSTLKIRKDDMRSAARSITNNLPPEKVRELIEELKP